MLNQNNNEEWREELKMHREKIFWKADPKIKGLDLREMYDADFVDDFIANQISQAHQQGKREGLKQGQAIAVLFKGNEMLVEFQKAINQLK